MSSPVTIEIDIDELRAHPVDQAHSFLTSVQSMVIDDPETTVRSYITTAWKGRHWQHTRGFLALMEQFGHAMDLPAREAPWVLLAGIDAPEAHFFTCLQAIRAERKPRLMRTSTWLHRLHGAACAMLLTYCDDVDDVKQLVGAARLRLDS